MKGEKYLIRRMNQMKRSAAGTVAAIRFRIIILLVVIGACWLTCDEGLKFLQSQPSYHTR